MLDQVMQVFDVKPDYNFTDYGVRQTLVSVATNILSRLSEVLIIEKPDIIIVHGIQTTTPCCYFSWVPPNKSLSCGSRIKNRGYLPPWSEEGNRKVTGH